VSVLLPVPAPCGVTVGGVLAVRLWPVANVRRYPTPEGVQLPEPLELFDATNVAELFFQEGTCGFEEPDGENEHGIFFKPQLQTIVLQDSPDVAEAISRLRGGKFLAAYEDANGFTKLVGTPDYPLSFRSELNTGKRGAERNGYQLTLAGLTPTPSVFYLQPAIEPPKRRKAFSAGFGNGFS
jgi:hypothetical protein